MIGTTRAVQTLILGVVAASGGLAQQQPDVGLVAGAKFRFLAGNLVGGSVVKGAPYSADAVTDMTQTLADGNRIVQHSTATQYRDSEGRERREQVLSTLGPFTAQSDPVQAIFISDPVAGVNYSLNLQDRSAIKLPVPSLPPPPPGGPGADVLYRQVTIAGAGFSGGAVSVGTIAGGPVTAIAGGAGGIATPDGNVMIVRKGMVGPEGAQVPIAPPDSEQLGSKTVEGVLATGTRTTITIPAGQIGNDKPLLITDERWYSPELQITVQSTHSDPRMGTTAYSLKNISRGEPSPALFQVPADYTVTDAPEPFIKKVKP
ncbi:MAG TPA: hypothetical protein VGR73_11330 [Bryobacteraceae bacterium]|nr:hypothetical protein [Bryobacteraceae bacterium]